MGGVEIPLGWYISETYSPMILSNMYREKSHPLQDGAQFFTL